MGCAHAHREKGRNFLERAVLQEPGEQEVSRLEQGEILLVLNLATRQESGSLEVEQGGCHDEKTARLIEIPGSALPANVGDELISHLVEGEFGDFKLVLRDQLEQKIEGAFEISHMYRETGGFLVQRSCVNIGIGGHTHRDRTSRANCS